MVIDLDKYKKVKEQVSSNTDEDLIVKINGNEYHLVNSEEYSIIQALNDMAALQQEEASNQTASKISIVCNGASPLLTYEEYEKIKQQINEAFDKTFKPKAEKMN